MAFRAYDQNQTFLLPPCLDEWVEEDHPARILSEIVDRLDLSCLRIAKETGRPPYHPKMLLKVLLWAYATGVRASRKIEEKLYSDIVFMWLAGMEKPNFRTICLFRHSNLASINNLFTEVLMLTKGLGLLRLGLVTLDGTKMQANAGIDSFKRIKEWRKEFNEVKKEVRQILEEVEAVDSADDRRYGSKNRGDELPKELEKSKERMKKIEKLLSEIEEGEDEDIRVSMTDPEARLMHRKSSYLPAYNAQAAVTEDQIIVYADITVEPVDVNQLLPALDGIKELCGDMPEKVAADSGYGGGKNLKGLEERRVDGYIPETDERNIGKMKRRNPELYGKEDFKYDEKKDHYVCPAGKVLSPQVKSRIKTKYSEREVTIYRTERGVCSSCEQKPRCTTTRNKVGRAVSRDRYEKVRARMRQKLKTEVGKEIYGKRKCLVEPVFGQIRVIEKFIQFLLRGLERVKIEWKWAAIVHNLLKIIRKVKAGEVRLAKVE